MLRGRDHACDQLLAFLDAYEAGDDASAIPFEGGCPIMNAAIESDHAHPGLQQRAREAMQGWHGLLARILAGHRRARSAPTWMPTRRPVS